VDIDITKVGEFTIITGGKEYKGKLVDDGQKRELIFDLLPGFSCILGKLRQRGKVVFEFENKRYFISGYVYCTNHHRVTLLKDSEITLDKRTRIRFETPALPATISEPGRFHKDIGKTSILDISQTGARIETHLIMKKEKTYILNTEFKTRHFLTTFQATFRIVNVEEKGGLYIYGISLEEISPDDRKKLNKYLIRLDGMLLAKIQKCTKFRSSFLTI